MKAHHVALVVRTSQFLRWWGAELRDCALDLLAFLAPSWRRALTVYVDSNRILVLDSQSTDGKPIAEIHRDRAQSALPQSPPDALAADETHGRRVRLILAVEYAFVRRLILPLAALPHLKSTVTLQLPKLMPLDVKQLLTAFEIAATTNPTSSVIDVDLAALKRTDVESICKGLDLWGLRVGSLHIGESAEAVPRFRFAISSGSGNVEMPRLDRWLVGAAAVLGFSCAALAATQTYRAEQALDIARHQTQSAASIALSRHQLLLARLEPLKALSQMEGTPSAALILADITALIPQDSWVTTFELKQRKLRLVGISPDPAGLVRRLASSTVLTDVELRSSMSVGIGTGKDRFEISAVASGLSP